MAAPNIMILAGSIRGGSLSAKLAAAADAQFRKLDCHAERIFLADFEMPIYNGDLEAASGIPDGVERLAKEFLRFQGFFIVTPEYNQSLPPLLKNSIDWLSRIRGDLQAAYRGKAFAIASISPGQFGGTRAIIDLRRVLVSAFNAIVIPDQISLPAANAAFSPTGQLLQEAKQLQLQEVCSKLVRISGLKM